MAAAKPYGNEAAWWASYLWPMPIMASFGVLLPDFWLTAIGWCLIWLVSSFTFRRVFQRGVAHGTGITLRVVQRNGTPDQLRTLLERAEPWHPHPNDDNIAVWIKDAER